MFYPFNIEIDGKSQSAMAFSGVFFPGQFTEIMVHMSNNQTSEVASDIRLSLQKISDGSLYLGILASKSNDDYGFGIESGIKDKADKCGIDYSSGLKRVKENSLSVWVVQHRELPLFYGDVTSEDPKLESDYNTVKKQLIDTDFLGPDQTKREAFVELLEANIKGLLNIKELASDKTINLISGSPATSEKKRKR